MLKLSVSSMDTYEKCPKKYHYTYIEKPNIQKKKWAHTEFGSCAHKMLELFHLRYMKEPFSTREAPAIMKECFVDAINEFNMHYEMIARRQRALGIEPGEDGLYTTADIAKMVFGDKEAETIGKLAAERRNVELKNAILEGELIPVKSVLSLCARVVVPLRQKILSSNLSEQERHELLTDIVKLGEIDWAEEAAHEQ